MDICSKHSKYKPAKAWHGIALTTALVAVAGCSGPAEPGAAEAYAPKSVSSNSQTDRHDNSSPFSTTPGLQAPELQAGSYTVDQSPAPPTQTRRGTDADSDGEDLITEAIDALDSSPVDTETGLQIEVDVNSGVVSFTPQSTWDYERIDVTLASPTGKDIVRTFAAGEPAYIEENLSDGVYSWEASTTVRVAPSIRAEMSGVRESGDLAAEQALLARLREEGHLPTEAQAQANRRFGQFAVKNGVVVRTDVAEQGGRVEPGPDRSF